MALFDISGIVSDLNTIIAGLDLPNEEEDRLTALIKSINNLGEDSSTIVAEIQDRVEAIDNTVLLEKFAILVGALSIGTEDRTVSVATVDDLPDLYATDSTPNGSIFFVQSIGVLVVSSGNKWLGLDGRTLRDDTPPVDAMTWGRTLNGTFGNLGDGTVLERSSPVTVIGGIINWSEIAVGDFHFVGLTTNGIIYSWGNGGLGQLGDGTNVNKSSPVTVVGGITNWSSISAGNGTSFGITNGVAYAWGHAFVGKLGDGSDGAASKSSPVTILGGITNWSSINGGRDHAVGVAGGVTYAWGEGANGRLGDDSIIDKSSPVTVVGGITNWSAASAGENHSLGLTNAGIAYGWGQNANGQLGDDSIVNRSSPVTVVGGITNWSQISAGDYHSLGVTTDGVAYAWGSNANGRLGIVEGNVTKSSPVTVVGGITNWSQVSAGGDAFSLGLTDTGVVYAWGFNGSGEVGDGTRIQRSSPVTVIGGITSWNYISAGSNRKAAALKTRV